MAPGPFRRLETGTRLFLLLLIGVCFSVAYSTASARGFAPNVADSSVRQDSVGQDGDEEELPFPELSITSKFPFLDELSTWQQHVVQKEGGTINKKLRGVFPIGDGYVFGYAGLGRRANTLQALTGPHYQTAEVNAPKGHFGELTLDVYEGDRRIALPVQRIWRTKGSNVVITEDATDDEGTLSLYTANFCVPPHKTIFRYVEVTNRGSTARTLRLVATWEKGKADGASSLSAEYPAKGYSAELTSTLTAKASGNTLGVDLPRIEKEKSTNLGLFLRTKEKGSEYAQLGSMEDLEAALTKHQSFWKERLASSMTTTCDRKKLADLIEDWKVLMLVQRDAVNGAVSPMVNYRGSWIRDNNGPILAFLRYSMHDEAKDILEYIHDATVVTGELRNHFPLDLDVSKAKELERTIDWAKVRVPNAELPSWIILQHGWYFRATWDLDLIKRHMPLLERCLAAIQPDSKGTLSTHGDETYLHGAFFSLFPKLVPHPSYLPADTNSRRARSLDNSLGMLMALDTMGELKEEVERDAAGEAGQDRKWESKVKGVFETKKIEVLQQIEAAFWMPELKRFAPFLSPITGAPHSAPYAPVNLKLQWIGYTYAIGEKNRENTLSTLKALWKKGNRIGMTPTVGYSTGNLQGYLLYTLADLDDSRRNDVLDSLIAQAGPAGEWGELYDPEGHPIASYAPEWPNRCRPWESGINIDAIFFALNGARYVTVPGWSKKDQRYKLRLPNGARWLSMKNMRHDGHVYNIYLDEVFRRDPKVDKSGKLVRKMRFRVHYDHVNYSIMQTEYVDLAVNAGGTLYIRYPKVGSPTNETTESWPVDNEKLFPTGEGPGDFKPRAPNLPAGETLFVTAGVSKEAPVGAQVLDIGLPITPQQFAAVLIDENGRPRYKKLVYDVGARQASRATFKTGSFWNHPSVIGAQRRFRENSQILRPRFFTKFQVLGPFEAKGEASLDAAAPAEKPENFRAGGLAWKKQTTSSQVLDLGRLTRRANPALAGKSYTWYLSVVIESEKKREAILKLGSDDHIKAWQNGKEIHSRKVHRTAAVDQDEVLITLQKGENRFLFKVVNDDGSSGFIGRLTTTKGLPVEGLRYR